MKLFCLDIFDQVVGFTKTILFLLPSWPLSQKPIWPPASWAIDSEVIQAQGIIIIPQAQKITSGWFNFFFNLELI